MVNYVTNFTRIVVDDVKDKVNKQKITVTTKFIESLNEFS